MAVARSSVMIAMTVFIAACATAVAPVPPYGAEIIADVPSEYVPRRPAWPPGRVLTYRITSFVETIAESGGRSTGSSSAVVTFSTRERTGRGFTRVDVAINNSKMGSVLFDAEGNLQDVVADRPEALTDLRGTLKAARHPLVAKYFGTALVKGKRYEANVAPREVIDDELLSKLKLPLHDRVTVQYDVVAFRTLFTRRVVELRGATPNMLRGSWPVPNATMSVESASGGGVANL
jgi:hypothetical protein